MRLWRASWTLGGLSEGLKGGFEELSEELDERLWWCAIGTDALQIALMALGVGPGDEVITPAFTFISTVEVVMLLGAKPVLVDVDARTFHIDPPAVEAAITKKTKAVIPVHLFGQCAFMGFDSSGGKV